MKWLLGIEVAAPVVRRLAASIGHFAAMIVIVVSGEAVGESLGIAVLR